MHHLFVSSIFIQNYLVFFFTANLNSGTQLFVCSIQSRKTGFIILYKQKAEKDWWVTLDKLATHATLAYYRHHRYMLLGTKSRTHSHVTAALEASNIDFFTNRMKNWNVLWRPAVYIFYAIPVSGACGASSVGFSFNRGFHCTWEYNIPNETNWQMRY